MDIGEITARLTVILAGLFCVVLLVAFAGYCFNPKKLNGYYLNHCAGEYKIYINWENAPDETAFKTYDVDELMRVYNQLKQEVVK